MQDRFKFRYVFEKDFGGKTGICYKMPVFNLDDAVRSVFENKILEYTNFGYKLITKNQCTGLKDKHGKLIYERDIVKTIYNRPDGVIINRNCVIEYNRGAFWINYGIGASYLSNDDCIYEVIGNIYENPKLLEVENE